MFMRKISFNYFIEFLKYAFRLVTLTTDVNIADNLHINHHHFMKHSFPFKKKNYKPSS